MFRSIAIVILASLVGNLCFLQNASGAPKDKDKDKNKSEVHYETRVYTRRQCLLGEPSVVPVPAAPSNTAERDFFPALLAIFAPILIGKALSGVSAALRKAGDEQTLRDTGRLPTYLYRLSRERKLALNPDLKCVIVIRGAFSGPDPENAPPLSFPESGIFTTEDQTKRIARLAANGIPVTKLASVFEAETKLSDDETAMLYKSKFFEISDFQGGRSSDTRAVVVSIAINGAGQKEGEPTLSVVMVNLGETKRVVLGPDKISLRTSWVGGLGMSDESLKAVENLKFPTGPTNPASPAYVPFLGVMPVTVEAVFAETDKGSKALRFIADVLDASKEDLTKKLSEEVTRNRGKEAAAASAEAATALEKARQEEETTFAAYLEAAALSTANATQAEVEVIQFKRLTATRAWCIKSRALQALGDNPPRPGAPACPAAGQ